MGVYACEIDDSLDKCLMLRKIEAEGEEKASEGEMPGWHHQGNGHELGQILGDGEVQRSLVCCSPWHFKASDMMCQLNNN